MPTQDSPHLQPGSNQAAFLAREKLKDEKGANFAKLNSIIIQTGVCTSCGACVAACPKEGLELDEVGRPRLKGKCDACGVCFHQCPRTITTTEGLVSNFVGSYKGKSLTPEVQGQDGGIVTTLLLYMLEKSLIDGAIVTQRSKEEGKAWKPEPGFVTTKEEILESAGSVYSQNFTVKALVDTVKAGYNSIAYVGTPCHIDAVTKMQESPTGLLGFMQANIFKIGLFCMDSFSREKLEEWFKTEANIQMDDIAKMTITKGKFRIFTKAGEAKDWPVTEMDHLRSSSCYYCRDLTSENADISVGSVGSPEGWSTILVRSSIAEDLLLDAANAGYIELAPLTRFGKRAMLNLAQMKKVQLYTISRRRRFVLRDRLAASEAEIEKPTPQAIAEDIDKIPKALKKYMRLQKSELSPDDRILRLSIKNVSGIVLFNVTIRIAAMREFFEADSWANDIDEFFPGEELLFEYPRVKNDSEYLLTVLSEKGKLLSKRIDIQKLLKRKAKATMRKT
ncbi:MAG: Coenzyme F420 hydrogenase/dehydrogenase, beta subunit C-terminal domain [Candidatus Hodarchaeales archaeon]